MNPLDGSLYGDVKYAHKDCFTFLQDVRALHDQASVLNAARFLRFVIGSDTIQQSMWNQEMKLVFRSTCNQKATNTEKKQTCKDKTKSNTKKSVTRKF